MVSHASTQTIGQDPPVELSCACVLPALEPQTVAGEDQTHTEALEAEWADIPEAVRFALGCYDNDCAGGCG